MNRIARIVLALLAMGFVGTPFARAPATPEQILTLADSKGAGEAVESLTKSGKWQSAVLPGIKAARREWLKVARALYPAADAGAREDLDGALTGALLKAPYLVLPLLKELWWSQSETACVFDYDSELPGGVEQYVQRLRKSLEKAPPAQLASLREACVHGIDMTMAELRKHGS